jgi:hypothetical protein
MRSAASGYGRSSVVAVSDVSSVVVASVEHDAVGFLGTTVCGQANWFAGGREMFQRLIFPYEAGDGRGSVGGNGRCFLCNPMLVRWLQSCCSHTYRLAVSAFVSALFLASNLLRFFHFLPRPLPLPSQRPHTFRLCFGTRPACRLLARASSPLSTAAVAGKRNSFLRARRVFARVRARLGAQILSAGRTLGFDSNDRHRASSGLGQRQMAENGEVASCGVVNIANTTLKLSLTLTYYISLHLLGLLHFHFFTVFHFFCKHFTTSLLRSMVTLCPPPHPP